MKENMMQIGKDKKEERKRIEERKKNALKYFKERLLKSEAGDLIAKLFFLAVLLVEKREKKATLMFSFSLSAT